MAVQTSALVNIHIPKEQASKATKPSDFLLFDWSTQSQSRPLTPDATVDVLMTLFNISDQSPVA